MPGPNDDDLSIERKLASSKASVQAEGLKLVDEKKRLLICGFLRRKYWNLAPADLPEIWQEVLCTLWLIAATGKFKVKGKLNALLCTIAVCRANDFLRWQRRRGNQQLDWEPCSVTPQGSGTLGEEKWAIARKVRKVLSKLEWRVLKHFARMILSGQCGIKIDELVAAANADGGEGLTRNQVKEALRRVRRKLRRLIGDYRE